MEALSVKCRQGGGEEEGEGRGTSLFFVFSLFSCFSSLFLCSPGICIIYNQTFLRMVLYATLPFYRWYSLRNLIALPVCLVFEESNYIVIKIVKIQWALAKCQIFLAVIDRTQCKAHKRTDITGRVDFGSLNAMEQLNGTLGTSKK